MTVYKDNKKWAEQAVRSICDYQVDRAFTNAQFARDIARLEILFDEHAGEVERCMMKAFEGHI